VQENPRFTVSSFGALFQQRLLLQALRQHRLFLWAFLRASSQARQGLRLHRPHLSLAHLEVVAVAVEVGFHFPEVSVGLSAQAAWLVALFFLADRPSIALTPLVAVADPSVRGHRVHRAHQARDLLVPLLRADRQPVEEGVAASQVRTSAGCHLRHGLQRHQALLAMSPSRSGSGASAAGKG
jgi:hypothetical protein